MDGRSGTTIIDGSIDSCEPAGGKLTSKTMACWRHFPMDRNPIFLSPLTKSLHLPFPERPRGSSFGSSTFKSLSLVAKCIRE